MTDWAKHRIDRPPHPVYAGQAFFIHRIRISVASSFVRMAVVLGLITAVGPFAIDMYLPALPSIGGALHASPALVQMTLTVFFVMLGVCQLVYGPLADIVGRKPPIYAGLGIFMAGSLGCAFAPSIGSLIFFGCCSPWAPAPGWWCRAPLCVICTPAMTPQG